MYRGAPPWDTNQSPPELLAFIQNHPPGRALDLGCGTGTNAIELARHGWQVTGVDFINQALEKARMKAEQSAVQVTFLQDDVTRLIDVQAYFDLILDIGCFHSIRQKDRVRYLENIYRLLAEGGTYLLYAFTTEDQRARTGISNHEIASLERKLKLTDRQDGTDRSRRSSWFTFENILVS